MIAFISRSIIIGAKNAFPAMNLRHLLFFAWALLVGFSGNLWSQDDEEAPPVSITSPDKATTFAYGSIKERALIWNKKEKVLVARITFTDAEQSNGASNDDTHDFRLPGVTFNEAKGFFYATSSKGEVIPVARTKKALFFNSIQILPNAAVRIQRLRGNVTVILEAISPTDPAMHAPAPDSDSTHSVDANKLLQ